MNVAANIAARDALTAALGGDQPVRKVTTYLTASEAQEALLGIAYKGEGAVTLDDVRDILERVRRYFDDLHGDSAGFLYVNAVLSRAGVVKVSDLWIGAYAQVFAYCQAILTYGANPFYSWDIWCIPDKVRTRWLLVHQESHSLWEEKTPPLAADADMGVEDVTGILEWERRFAKKKENEL